MSLGLAKECLCLVCVETAQVMAMFTVVAAEAINLSPGTQLLQRDTIDA